MVQRDGKLIALEKYFNYCINLTCFQEMENNYSWKDLSLRHQLAMFSEMVQLKKHEPPGKPKTAQHWLLKQIEVGMISSVNLIVKHSIKSIFQVMLSHYYVEAESLPKRTKWHTTSDYFAPNVT